MMHPFLALLITLSLGICSSVSDGFTQTPQTTSSTTSDDYCGRMIYSNSSGVITSPRFPLSYPSGQNCYHDIIAGENRTVVLQFISFNLEDPSSTGCEYDYVTINCLVNGTNVTNPYTNRRFCGEIKWSSAIRFSGCTHVVLIFFSDSSTEGGGFKIQYNVSASGDVFSSDNLPSEIPCGNTSFSQSSGIITLPRNPTGYLARINCTYVVSANQSSFISLSMSSFVPIMRYSFQNCKDENLAIECEGKQSKVVYLCDWPNYPSRATWTMTPSFRSCRILKFSLRSDLYDVQGTLRIPFTVVADAFLKSTTPVPQSTYSPGSATVCNLTYTESSGVIETPGLPVSYSRHQQQCDCNIIVGENKSVVLEFLSFNVGSRYSSDNCWPIYVMIDCLMNGKNVTTPYTNRKFCGEIKWSSAMKLSGCTTVVLKYFSWTRYYYGSFRILYNVSAPDGPVSDDNLSNDISCGETLYTQSGSIILPRNPTGYLARINCTYTISANESSRIIFNTSSSVQKLRSSLQNCILDTFTIRCEDKYRVLSLCSSYPSIWSPSHSFIQCKILTLSLQSNIFDVQEALQIPFTVVSEALICGGNTSFSGDSGSIVSPGYPRSYENNLNCTYTINVGRNRSILLEAEEFELGEHSSYGSCYRDWIMIRCLPNRTYSNPYLNTRHCERMVPALVLHGCQAVTIQFYTDDSVSGRGFKFFYAACESGNCAINSSKLSRCGNTAFTDSSGFITSPGYPESYYPGLNCIYTVAVPRNKTITLDFLAFAIRSSYSWYERGLQYYCTNDWIMVHCMSGETELPSDYTNRKFCGLHAWEFMLHGCESVMLHFTSENTITMSRSSPLGFKIFYEISSRYSDCGNTSFSGSSGIITSPNFPGRYFHNLNCFYSIAMEQSDSVSLEFLTFDVDNGTHINILSTPRPGLVVTHPSGCVNDWLMISCVPEKRVNQFENTRLCGPKEVPFTWTVSGCMFLNLIFISDSTLAKSGFKIQYDIISPTTTVTSPSQTSEMLTSSNPQFTPSVECEMTCQNNSKCECSTQLSSSPNSVAKGAEESRGTRRVSPLLLLLVAAVLVGLVIGLVFLIRRRRSLNANHKRLHINEEENLESRSSENVSLAENSEFQGIGNAASVKYVPMKTVMSDDKEVLFSSGDASINNI